jgi:TolB-like protein
MRAARIHTDIGNVVNTRDTPTEASFSVPSESRQSAMRQPRLAVSRFESVGEVREFRRVFEAELAAQIGRVSSGGLTVLAHSTSVHLRHALGRPCQIGRILGVTYIVEGSICADADRVHVTAALVDVAREVCIWSETADCVVTGSIAQPISMVRELLQSMKPTLERLAVASNRGG